MLRDDNRHKQKHMDINLAHESYHAAEHQHKMVAMCFWLVMPTSENPIRIIFLNLIYQLN